MTTKDIMSKLSKADRRLVNALINEKTDPKVNGGYYIGPNEWKDAVNSVLSSVLKEDINLNRNVLNSIASKLDRY